MISPRSTGSSNRTGASPRNASWCIVRLPAILGCGELPCRAWLCARAGVAASGQTAATVGVRLAIRGDCHAFHVRLPCSSSSKERRFREVDGLRCTVEMSIVSIVWDATLEWLTLFSARSEKRAAC
jgi:hypothetical protein